MQPQDLIHVTRVRLAALSQAARVGGQVTAYDLARAVQPALDLALQVGIEAGCTRGRDCRPGFRRGSRAGAVEHMPDRRVDRRQTST